MRPSLSIDLRSLSKRHMIRLKSAYTRPSSRPSSKGTRSLAHSLSSSPGRSLKAPLSKGATGKWIAVDQPHSRPWTAAKSSQKGLDWKGFWSSPKAEAKAQMGKTTLRPGKSLERSFDEVIIGIAPKLPTRSSIFLRTSHPMRSFQGTKRAIKAWVEPGLTLDSLLATPVHSTQSKVTVGTLLRVGLKASKSDSPAFLPLTANSAAPVLRRTQRL